MSNQRTSDDKAAYHTPALTVFGSLTAVTLSGTGTTAETRTNISPGSAICVYTMRTIRQGMMYPCA
jgi:hypothetical protein